MEQRKLEESIKAKALEQSKLEVTKREQKVFIKQK